MPDGATATMEESYADGVSRAWTSWTGEAPREVQLSDADREEYQQSRLDSQRRWMHNATWTADPIGGIRTMLDSGMLASAGRTTLEGRSVLRLVGEEPGTAQNRSPGGPIRYEYLVDPTSFAPVRVSSTSTVRTPDENGEHGEHYVTTWTFSLFEQLPLNDSTRHLLVAGSGH